MNLRFSFIGGAKEGSQNKKCPMDSFYREHQLLLMSDFAFSKQSEFTAKLARSYRKIRVSFYSKTNP